MTLALAPPASAERSWNLFEWIAVAPIVVVGEVLVDDQRYVELEIHRVLRGDLEAGTVIPVDLRYANRDRRDGRARLDLEKGRSYLALLSMRNRPTRRGDRPYDVVRGTAGARALGEGSAAIVDAAAKMAVWQDRRDEPRLWKDLGNALADENPFLVETALDLFVKFERAHADLLPALRPLLDAPRPVFRAKAAALTGEAAARDATSPASREAVAALVALARRDDVVDVRIAATRALGLLHGRTPIEALREIARSDPDQTVRYEAQRILVERRAPPETPRIDLPESAP